MVGLGLLKQYQIDRLNVFAGDPTTQASAYNQEQSTQAIANGRFGGEGFEQGSQTQGSFVPEQHTDFIFTAVGEELGFVGAVGLLGLLAVVMWRVWRTARLARDFFGMLVCTGVLAMLAFQIFENVGMTMGIMPVTGIPLPVHELRRVVDDRDVRLHRPRAQRLHAPLRLNETRAVLGARVACVPTCRTCGHGWNPSWPGSRSPVATSGWSGGASVRSITRSSPPGFSSIPTPTRSGCPTRGSRSCTRS